LKCERLAISKASFLSPARPTLVVFSPTPWN
jgi:hypothetical protein